jgi:hypothetical protein
MLDFGWSPTKILECVGETVLAAVIGLSNLSPLFGKATSCS